MHTLLEPWRQGLVQRAFLELAIVGLLGGALGCWVIFYSFSYSAESLAHALFPGLVGAALLGVPLIAGAAVGVAGAAIAIAAVSQVPGLDRDTSVAVVITSLFGVGVLLALEPASPPGLALAFLHRLLLAVGFDRLNARALGATPAAADAALLSLVAVAILVGVQALGNLLVLAVIVGPAATARLLTRRIVPMMALAGLLAIVGAAAGLYLSYYADTAAGASVAVAIVALFVLVLIWRALGGLSGLPRAAAARTS